VVTLIARLMSRIMGFFILDSFFSLFYVLSVSSYGSLGLAGNVLRCVGQLRSSVCLNIVIAKLVSQKGFAEILQINPAGVNPPYLSEAPWERC